MGKKMSVVYVMAAAAILSLSSCSPCYRATKLRKKARRASGAEQHRLKGQAASLEAACLKKRDQKYESEMQKEFEKMEEKARD